MTRPPSVDVDPYRSWRAWFRLRHRTRCLVCGEKTAGHLTQTAAVHEAYRHLAWHGLLNAILRRAMQDGTGQRASTEWKDLQHEHREDP